MVRTSLRLPSGGEHLQVRDRLRILEDFFAVCSALHGRIREIADPLDQKIQEAKSLIVRSSREMAGSFRRFGR